MKKEYFEVFVAVRHNRPRLETISKTYEETRRLLQYQDYTNPQVQLRQGHWEIQEAKLLIQVDEKKRAYEKA